MTLRIGSICTGYGGLDHAVQDVFGGELAWVADIDPGANQILAHRYPHLPNLGDITTVDWSQVEPVDIFTGGFPCQPVSAAGQRRGITDERWLFDDICSALGRMVTRPRLLVFENVPGLLTANGGDAMARVVQGLAALGYVGSWRTVRASDVGAPHRRERVFILARLATADPLHLGHERRREARLGRPGPSDGYLAAPDAASLGHGNARPAGERGLPAPPVTGDPSGHVQWGAYEPAIRRWERILGRRAPRPTEPGRNGERLSPRFVEWMMGLPAGHVTGVPGLTRNAQLKALGNGVVPQQAAYALRLLSARAGVRGVAA